MEDCAVRNLVPVSTRRLPGTSTVVDKAWPEQLDRAEKVRYGGGTLENVICNTIAVYTRLRNVYSLVALY